MSKLLQIAAKLVTLPQEDAPEYLYVGCKQIAAELRDFHDTELAAKTAECEKLLSKAERATGRERDMWKALATDRKNVIASIFRTLYQWERAGTYTGPHSSPRMWYVTLGDISHLEKRANELVELSLKVRREMSPQKNWRAWMMGIFKLRAALSRAEGKE